MSRINVEEFLEYLYGRLPTEWRLLDQQEGLPLYNYLKVIVYGGMKKNIDLANKFTELTDPVRCPSSFFPTLYESIGLKYDWGIGEIYHRRLFQNIGELMRRRGSYNSIRYLIRVLTGMECNLDYQRSPVKHYENTDIVSFQGYDRGDITVIEMRGNTAQQTTVGYNLFNSEFFYKKEDYSGNCTTKIYDNGTIEVTGSYLADDQDISFGYTYTDEERRKLKPGIYTLLGTKRNTNPYPYFKFNSPVNNSVELSRTRTELDITQRMIEDTNAYNKVVCGVWGIKQKEVVPGLCRPYVVCDSSNPNMFDVYGLRVRNAVTYKVLTPYSFECNQSSTTDPEGEVQYTLITKSHYSEFVGKTIYFSGEIVSASDKTAFISIYGRTDDKSFIISKEIKRGVGKFRNVPYIVPAGGIGMYLQLNFRPKAGGTLTVSNIRVTEKPYVDDNVVSNGLNLLNPCDFDPTKTLNGITFTNNGDGSVTINGTNTANNNIYYTLNKEITKGVREKLQGKTLTLSGGSIEFNAYLQVFSYNSDDKVSKDYGDGLTFDFNNTDKKFNIVIGVPAKARVNNVTIWPMLVYGSEVKPWEPYTYGMPIKGHVTPTEKDTPYEPYSMGSPSPSIEFRRPFKSVGDKVNLFNLRNPTLEIGKLQFTNNGDGSFTLNGSHSSDVTLRLDQSTYNGADNLVNYGTGYYTLTLYPIKGDAMYTVKASLWDSKTDKVLLSTVVPTALPWTNTDSIMSATGYISSASSCAVCLTIPARTVFNGDTFKIQLEKGSFATDWKPYNTYSFEFITSKGRRNLLSNTNQGYNDYIQYGWASFERVRTPSDKNAIKIICGRTGDYYGVQNIIPAPIANTFKPNAIYQVSFDCYINSTLDSTVKCNITDAYGVEVLQFDSKSVNVKTWNSVQFSSKYSDFLQANIDLYLAVYVSGPNTHLNDYIIIQNLQLHETYLPNEWVPSLEDTTAGIPNNDDVQLFDASKLYNFNDTGTKYTVTSNVITVSTTQKWGLIGCDVTELVRGRQITLSATIKAISGNINKMFVQLMVDDRDGNRSYYDNSTGKVSPATVTYKVGADVKKVVVRLIANNTENTLETPAVAVFTDVMLNFGNIPYPWRPFDQSTAIVPKPESVDNYIQRALIKLSAPLRSCGLINPIRDRIVRTGTKSAYVWKVHRRIGVQTLNGTESWEMSLVQGSYIRFALINNDLYDIAGPRMCDGLPYESVYDNTMLHECIHSSPEDGRIGITILLSRLNTSDVLGFTSWLKSNNLTVLYGRAQIEYEDLDRDSQAQLSKIDAYNSEHTTYMYTMDSVNPELLVEYTGFGRYLFIAMLAADIEQLRNMDNSVKLVERFLTQFVPYYITPVVSGEVSQQEITGTHHMGVIVTESKIYTLVQYRSDNLTPQ